MASTSERSKSADALPRPELNPLLNPLLSDNMGRWAEVYFTSPPERREEAVIELLHELEQEKERAELHPDAGANFGSPAPRIHFEPQVVETQKAEQKFCGACGSKNPATHQFCGMCGAKLYSDSSVPESRDNGQDPAPQKLLFVQERAPEPVAFESYEQGPDLESQDVGETPVFHAPAAGSDELSLFQSFRAPEPDQEWDYEPPPSSSYRFYIAAILVIVIGALGYMAWRGAQTSQSAHEVSPPPPAPVTESAQPATPAPQASGTPQTPTPAQKTADSKSEAESTASAPAPVKTASSPRNRVAEREVAAKTPPPAPAEQTSPQPASSSGGIEELAMAERYLNGSAGGGRNSSEAATWLWKSIAKHNGQATILLADLYLRGDGVSKNCEQGRILLDSAARNGVPGAGDRLRNLQAFGCH